MFHYYQIRIAKLIFELFRSRITVTIMTTISELAHVNNKKFCSQKKNWSKINIKSYRSLRKISA